MLKIKLELRITIVSNYNLYKINMYNDSVLKMSIALVSFEICKWSLDFKLKSKIYNRMLLYLFQKNNVLLLLFANETKHFKLQPQDSKFSAPCFSEVFSFQFFFKWNFFTGAGSKNSRQTWQFSVTRASETKSGNDRASAIKHLI